MAGVGSKKRKPEISTLAFLRQSRMSIRPSSCPSHLLKVKDNILHCYGYNGHLGGDGFHLYQFLKHQRIFFHQLLYLQHFPSTFFHVYKHTCIYIYLHIGSCFRTTAVGTKPRCKPTSPSGPGLVRTPVELHAPGPSDVFTVWEEMSGVDQIPRKNQEMVDS